MPSFICVVVCIGAIELTCYVTQQNEDVSMLVCTMSFGSMDSHQVWHSLTLFGAVHIHDGTTLEGMLRGWRVLQFKVHFPCIEGCRG